MSRFAIDAPTFLLVARGERSPHPFHQLVAPNTLRTAALELLLGEVRGGTLTDKEALAIHERLTELKVRLLGDRVSRRTAWQIARGAGWDSLGAAEYLAVAKLQADALVTVDPELAAAAEGVVTVASFDDLFAKA